MSVYEDNKFQLINKELKQTQDNKKPKLLSICIPVYNRKYIFKWCLISICEACKGYEDLVEIVVSDNASADDLYSVIKQVNESYPSIDIMYNRNSTNLGVAKNILKVVEGASGQFCWSIGSDDFVKPYSISTILNILREHEDIDFIACNFDHINIDDNLKITDREMETNISERLKDSRYLMSQGSPTASFKVDKLDYIIDPGYNNVLLGALMTGIFRRNLWNQVKIDEEELNGYDSLINIYPHIYIYASAFLGRKAYYCGQHLVTVGEGTREWSTDTGNSLWESSLPIIYFKVFTEIANCYKSKGLEPELYIKCENWLASYAGDLLVPLIWKKYVTKEYVKDIDKISPFETSLLLLENKVYRQVAINKLRNEYYMMENQYNNMEKSLIGDNIIKLFKYVLDNYYKFV